jgi:hypothetical protein
MLAVRRLTVAFMAAGGLLVTLGDPVSAAPSQEVRQSNAVRPEPPFKNAKPVTPDILPKLLKKASKKGGEAHSALPAGVPAAVIQPGPYQLSNTTTTHSKCLDADKWPVDQDGTRVQLWDCNGESQQQWYFWHLNSNNYLIANARHGRILDADLNAICCNGARVQLWRHIPGNLNQTWWVWTDGLGLYIQNNHPLANRRVIDVDTNGHGANGTKIQLWTWNGENQQNWAGPPRP